MDSSQRFGGMVVARICAAPADTIAFLALASCGRLAWGAVSQAKWTPFLASVTIPLIIVVVGIVLTVLAALGPRVYDLYLVRFDEILGGQASALVGCWFQNHRTLPAVCRVAYQELPLVQSVVVAGTIAPGGRWIGSF